MELKRNFHIDPGHGWLAVKYSEVLALGIANQISEYSYFKKGIVYLEEDCDAGIYFEAIKANGDTLKCNNLFCEDTDDVFWSPIRDYPQYRRNL